MKRRAVKDSPAAPAPPPPPPPPPPAAAVFTEAEVRASLVFQLSKLASMLIKVGAGGWVGGWVRLLCVGAPALLHAYCTAEEVRV